MEVLMLVVSRLTRITAVFVLVLAGCATSRQVQRRSNLMSYLYPEASGPQTPNPAGARLQLPLRIGLAFVPPDRGQSRYAEDFRASFPAATETQLLNIVKRNFQGRDWVSDIVVIPSSYLVARGGFSNLEQVARLMNVDVVALASIDQLQVSNPRRASFLYLSIIGAYVLPLDKNETRTMIDVAAFHVPSRTFLLRAPGTNVITGTSAAMDVDAKLEERSVKSFEMAMADLSKNLSVEVDQFKAAVASGQVKNVDIVTKEGKSVRGGGSFGWLGAAVALLALALVMRKS
jgi:rhombotail lipoprotein